MRNGIILVAVDSVEQFLSARCLRYYLNASTTCLDPSKLQHYGEK